LYGHKHLLLEFNPSKKIPRDLDRGTRKGFKKSFRSLTHTDNNIEVKLWILQPQVLKQKSSFINNTPHFSFLLFLLWLQPLPFSNSCLDIPFQKLLVNHTKTNTISSKAIALLHIFSFSTFSFLHLSTYLLYKIILI